MIILAATPIGNLQDASPRLIEALATVPVIAAEDTRVASRLLAGLGVRARPRLISLHDHNEREKAPAVLELAETADVLVISDAGMPTVSDPGFRLVQQAAAAGIRVTALPGPSAVLTALAVAGLPTDRFAFEGFLPRKEGERAAALRGLARDERTLVFFESPNRLGAALAAMAGAFGASRPAAVCRELTKLHEEVRRGTLAELAAWAADPVRGEIVVVVSGTAPRAVDLSTGIQEVLLLTATGERLKDAAASVAEATGLSRRDLYQGALAERAR